MLRSVTSATIAVLSIVGLFIADLPLVARAIAVACVAVVVALFFVRGRVRLFSILALVLLAACTTILVVQSRPSPAEQVVAEYVAETLEANIWVAGEPEGYPASEEFMVENFAAFDPARSHSWQELANPTGASLSSVISEASLLAGRTVAFAGTVNAANQLGNGEYVVQLIPLWPEDSDALHESQVATALLPESGGFQAFDNAGISDPHASRQIVYVRITPRNFVVPHSGDVWLVKGVTLAYGRTLRGDGGLADVAYVAGSSVEHFDSVHDAQQ
jgi:hypothetical protein